MWDFKDGVAFVFLTYALSGECFSIAEQVPSIDLETLTSKDPKSTLKMAFRLANTYLGVPITLFPNPDSFDFLSVLFYVSNFMKFDLRNRPDRGSILQLPLSRPSYFEIRKSKSWAWLFGSSSPKEKESSSSTSSSKEDVSPHKSSKKEKKDKKSGWFPISATVRGPKEKKGADIKSKTLRMEGSTDIDGNVRGKKLAKRRSEKSRHKKGEPEIDIEVDAKGKGKKAEKHKGKLDVDVEVDGKAKGKKSDTDIDIKGRGKGKKPDADVDVDHLKGKKPSSPDIDIKHKGKGDIDIDIKGKGKKPDVDVDGSKLKGKKPDYDVDVDVDGKALELDASIVASISTPVFRYHSSAANDHFYTSSIDEMGTTAPGGVGHHGYICQGISFYVSAAPQPGLVPLYRYWNEKTKDHFYSTNSAEIGATTSGAKGNNGFVCEGIVGYLSSSPFKGGYAIYRYWNEKISDHLYTTNGEEMGTTTQGSKGNSGYICEGILGYTVNLGGKADIDIDIQVPKGKKPDLDIDIDISGKLKGKKTRY